MKELFGTTLIVILAFLAGLLAFWFRKFLLAGIALALLLSGCGSGPENDPNDPNSSSDFLNAFSCPVPSNPTNVWPHPFLVIKDSVTCDSTWLTWPPFKGLTCHDLVTDDLTFETQNSSAVVAYAGEEYECGVVVSSPSGARSNLVTESKEWGVTCRSGGSSQEKISSMGESDTLVEYLGCSDNMLYALCTTLGSFQGWACLNPSVQ